MFKAVKFRKIRPGTSAIPVPPLSFSGNGQSRRYRAMKAILSMLLFLTQAACGFTLVPKSHAIVDPPQQNQPQQTLKTR
jgi:hypothetical protein